MKKLTGVLALLLVFCFVLSSCSKNDSKKSDDKTVVAKVNGEAIYKYELTEQYDKEKLMYGITEEIENDADMAGSIKQFKLDVLDNMINNRILLQKAKKDGFIKDESFLKKAEDYYNDTLKQIAEEMKKEDSGSEDGTEVDYDLEAKKYLEDYIAENGWTKDEYIKLLADQIFIDEYINRLVADVEATEDDLKDYYNEQLEEQKKNGRAANGEVSIFQGNQVRIKYMMFDLPQEEIIAYQNMFAGGSFEEAEEFIKEKLAAIKPKADEAYEKLKNGESFEQLLEEYNPDMWVGQLKDGYLMEKNDPYLASLEDTVFKLEEGEVSEIVETPYGYFIVKAYELIDEKTYSFDDKKEEIKELLNNKLKYEKFKEMMDKWNEESEIEIFEDKI